jgi:hypothetical protein
VDNDVELMRELLLQLEDYQTSPRSVVVISAELEAESLEREADEVEACLAVLHEFDYIDGPGPDAPGFFLFRKLTQKGARFVRESRDPRAWEKMKRHYAQLLREAEPD